MNSEKNIRLLRAEFQLLEKSLFHLLGSLRKCEKVGFKEEYSFDELESFDSLTGRFARSADIYMQKVLRTIFVILREEAVLFTDRMYKAEKAGIIKNADKLLEIKDVRNDIVHQYIPEASYEMIKDILTLSVSLLENIESTKVFMIKRNWLP
jgi:hypothetical protein